MCIRCHTLEASSDLAFGAPGVSDVTSEDWLAPLLSWLQRAIPQEPPSGLNGRDEEHGKRDGIAMM